MVAPPKVITHPENLRGGEHYRFWLCGEAEPKTYRFVRLESMPGELWLVLENSIKLRFVWAWRRISRVEEER